MKTVFLGPFVHWIIIVVLVALGWLAGSERFHVSQFNPFLILLLVLTVAIVMAVLWTSRPGQQVTRDPIKEHQDDETG